MMMGLSTVAALYGLVGMACIAAAVMEWRRNGVTVLAITYLWVLAVYSIVPAFIELGCDACRNPSFGTLGNGEARITTALIISMSVLAFVGAASFLSQRLGQPVAPYGDLAAPSRREDAFAISAGAFAILAFIGFIVVYGGLDYVLANISQIRSGTDARKNYFGAFLKMFYFYGYFAAVYFFVSYRASRQNAYLLWAAFFFAASCGMAFLGGGRLHFINLFIAIGLAAILSGARLRVLPLAGIAVGGVLVLVFGKTSLFQLFSGRFSVPDFDPARMAVEFSHQYLSLLNAVNLEGWDFRLFGDYLYWAVKPLKLLGLEAPDSISYFNTFLITGDWDSNIPPGMVAFGYLSLGVPGVVIHALFSAVSLWGLSVTLSAKGRTPAAIAFYVLACTNAPYFVWNSDPALFLQTNLPIFMLFCAYLVLGWSRRRSLGSPVRVRS